jgi:hypothetical protein
LKKEKEIMRPEEQILEGHKNINQYKSCNGIKVKLNQLTETKQFPKKEVKKSEIGCEIIIIDQ